MGMQEMAKVGNFMTKDLVSLSNTSTLQAANVILFFLGFIKKMKSQRQRSTRPLRQGMRGRYHNLPRL